MKEDNQLARWLAGEMDKKELEELEKSSRYATLLRIKENFEQIQRPSFEADAMLEEILKKEKTKVKTVPLYQKYWLQGVAASIAILLGVWFIFTLPEKHSTSYGQTFAFTLPDQSSVTLNSGSEASYRTWNWDSNRNINLEGEAYFKVAKGKKFCVTTSLGKVTVLGTQFNVKSRKNRLDVVCYEGKVRVEYNGKETILTPQKALIVESGISTNGVAETLASAPEWIHGELVFRKENLPGILSELERKYNVTIKTDLQTDKRFTGIVPGNDIDGALKIISRLYHLDVDKQGKTITLKTIHAKM
jgi:ferric-dicitrate binding protein FerR (iron transport regulator)